MLNYFIAIYERLYRKTKRWEGRGKDKQRKKRHR
jgi:hypothetical protein